MFGLQHENAVCRLYRWVRARSSERRRKVSGDFVDVLSCGVAFAEKLTRPMFPQSTHRDDEETNAAESRKVVNDRHM